MNPFETKSVTFAEPIEMLYACHGKVRRFGGRERLLRVVPFPSALRFGHERCDFGVALQHFVQRQDLEMVGVVGIGIVFRAAEKTPAAVVGEAGGFSVQETDGQPFFADLAADDGKGEGGFECVCKRGVHCSVLFSWKKSSLHFGFGGCLLFIFITVAGGAVPVRFARRPSGGARPASAGQWRFRWCICRPEPRPIAAGRCLARKRRRRNRVQPG